MDKLRSDHNQIWVLALERKKILRACLEHMNFTGHVGISHESVQFSKKCKNHFSVFQIDSQLPVYTEMIFTCRK